MVLLSFSFTVPTEVSLPPTPELATSCDGLQLRCAYLAQPLGVSGIPTASRCSPKPGMTSELWSPLFIYFLNKWFDRMYGAQNPCEVQKGRCIADSPRV
ncbi:hypothetical protein GDO78_013484 [Eleutherodactylus coqui]|uniref:Uncharacterized protein n=1 Tax=Eleutherodactylus coqui TaxID=57060 RepID=A0A8J6EYJ0_ELECQ|nr:hypothetical protein GDO78_013484 [Eleutherodactylus coqui]